MYVGSPSICIMSNGDYIATHDLFANSQTEYNTEVYKSEDRGLTWKRQSVVKGQFWSSVFCISDTLYLIGTDREYGNLVVRRSTDGKSWTTPSDSHHGLLAESEYHSVPLSRGGASGKDMEGHRICQSTRYYMAHAV